MPVSFSKRMALAFKLSLTEDVFLAAVCCTQSPSLSIHPPLNSTDSMTAAAFCHCLLLIAVLAQDYG